MQLLIAQNPHTKNPQDLMDAMAQDDDKPQEYDGVEQLKLMLKSNPRFIVKS